jgi:hypoxanthine phosphoribosyltransferase
MNKIRLKDKEFELFIRERDIQRAVARIAAEIKKDVRRTNPLFVGMLNGAFMFIADMAYHLNGAYELTFAHYTSYQGINTTKTMNEILPLRTDVRGRSVVLLEDIVDTGFTMHYLLAKLKKAEVADVKLATMLFKPAALQYDIKPDYVGLEIPNDFIVGHGLDYDDLGRAYRDIYRIV